MSVHTHPLTYDDLRTMPDDGNRYEIIDGELLVAPSPGFAHQWVANRLHLLVGNYVVEHRLGECFFAPVDVRLSPHDVVQPDLLFIRQERMDIYNRRGDVEGPPDLAVEIISPSSEKIDPDRKFDLYARTGVAEYWLVDPLAQTVRVFTHTGERYVEVEPTAGCFRSVIIPGLVLDPTVLFSVPA